MGETILKFYVGDFNEESSEFSSLKPNLEFSLESWKNLSIEEIIEKTRVIPLPRIEKTNLSNRLKIGKNMFWETTEEIIDDYFFFAQGGEKHFDVYSITLYLLFYFIANMNEKRRSFFLNDEIDSIRSAFNPIDKFITNNRRRFLVNNITLTMLFKESSMIDYFILRHNEKEDNSLNFSSSSYSFAFYPKEYLDIEEFITHKSFHNIIHKYREISGEWFVALLDGEPIKQILDKFLVNYDLFYREKKKKRKEVKSARKIL